MKKLITIAAAVLLTLSAHAQKDSLIANKTRMTVLNKTVVIETADSLICKQIEKQGGYVMHRFTQNGEGKLVDIFLYNKEGFKIPKL